MRTSLLICSALLLCAHSASAVGVTLVNGDTLNGEISRREGSTIYLDHPQLGRLKLTEDMLEKRLSQPTGQPELTPQSEERAEEIAEARAEAEEQDEPRGFRKYIFDFKRGGLLGSPILRGWQNSFGLGLSGSEGGFEDTKLSVLFESTKEGPKRKWHLDSFYFFNVRPPRDGEEERISKNQAMFLGRHDWLRTEQQSWSRLFAFAQSRYQFDEFQPWKHRFSAHVGPGYKLLRESKAPGRLELLGSFDLQIRLGLGGSYALGSIERGGPEGLTGFTLVWRINQWSTVRSVNEWIFDMTETAIWRTNQQLDWNLDLGDVGGMGVRFGTRFRHDTQSEGRENDFTYLAGLTYDF